MSMEMIEPGLALLTQLLKTVATMSHIGQVPELVAKVPTTLLLVGHCLAIAGMTKNAYSGKLMGYVMVGGWCRRVAEMMSSADVLFSYAVQGFALAFGGNITSHYFLGTGTSSLIFTGNEALLLWTVAWWLLNCNPVSLVDNVMDSAPVGISARVRL